jgi:hypothetical protein
MFQNWTNFFLTTAAVGAQLIGLLFVVVAIGSSLSRSQSVAGIRAFLTPTLTCFSGVLLQALVVLVPWPSDWPRGVMLKSFDVTVALSSQIPVASRDACGQGIEILPGMIDTGTHDAHDAVHVLHVRKRVCVQQHEIRVPTGHDATHVRGATKKDRGISRRHLEGC